MANNKIFSFNGSQLIDQVTGSALNNSGIEIKRGDKGLSGDNNSAGNNITCSSFSIGANDDYTVNCDFRAKGFVSFGSGINAVFSLNNVNTGISLYINSLNSIIYRKGTGGIVTVLTNAIGWYNFQAIRKGGTLSLYLNNNLITTQADTSSFSSYVLRLFNDASTGRAGNVSISKMSIYDGAIDNEERIKLYEDFQNPMILAETKRDFYYKKPDRLEEDSLIASYNFIPSEGEVVVDTSGNGKNMDISAYSGGKPMTRLNGLMFNGGRLSGSTITLGTIFSINFRIIPTNTPSGRIFSSLNLNVYFVSSTLVILIGTNSAISYPVTAKEDVKSLSIIKNGTNVVVYINGVAQTPVTLVSDSDCTITDFGFGGTTPIYELIDFNAHNRAYSEQEAKDYHNKYANQVYYRNTFKHEESDGITTDSPEIIKGTGVYVTKTVDKATETSLMPWGTNYRECTISGTEKILYDQTTDVDARILFYTGGTWTKYEDTLTNLIATHAWLSLSGGYLTYTMTAGERRADILYRKGVAQ